MKTLNQMDKEMDKDMIKLIIGIVVVNIVVVSIAIFSFMSYAKQQACEDKGGVFIENYCLENKRIEL